MPRRLPSRGRRRRPASARARRATRARRACSRRPLAVLRSSSPASVDGRRSLRRTAAPAEPDSAERAPPCRTRGRIGRQRRDSARRPRRHRAPTSSSANERLQSSRCPWPTIVGGYARPRSRLSPWPPWRSTSSAARPPSPGPSSCSTTERARVLIDCGMFQGSPNESVRNRIPFAFDPSDARRGPADPRPPRPLRPAAAARQGRLRAGRSTPRRRRSSWRRSCCSTRAASTRSSPSARRAGRSATPTRSRPTTARRPTPTRRRSTWPRPARSALGGRRRRTTDAETSDHRTGPSRAPALATRPRGRAARPAAAPRDRPRRAALHGQGRRAVARPVPAACATTTRSRSRRGSTPRSSMPATSSARRSSGCASQDQDGGEERVIVCSGDLGRPGTPILRDPTTMTDADYVLVESTYGGREHEPRRRGHPDPGRDDPDGRRGERACCSSRRSRSGGPRRSSGSSIG